MVTYSHIAGKQVVSYSKLEDLHSCPRKYELLNIVHANPLSGGEDNVDFMFGHMVGNGLQMLKAGLSGDEAVLYSSLDWKVDINVEMPRKKKSFAFGLYAVRLAETQALPMMSEYDIFEWVGNDGVARSGVETYFRIELENKAVYEGHIDLLLIHKVTRKLCVFEVKTNAFSILNEATYANSYQVDGYSMFCALLQERYGEEYNIAYSPNVDVRYIVYKVPAQEYELMPLTKGYRHWRKFWTDVTSDLVELERYATEGNYPCRGGACYDYFRPCFFFGTCHYTNDRFASYDERFAEAEDEPESFSNVEVNNLLNSLSITVENVLDNKGIVNPDLSSSTGLTAFEL